MAYKFNMTIDQGATFSQVFYVKDIDGNSLNMKSYSGNSQMRKHYTSTNAVSFAVDLSANGEATISLSAANTAMLVPGRYLYNIEISQGSTVERVVEGIATVTPDVTR